MLARRIPLSLIIIIIIVIIVSDIEKPTPFFSLSRRRKKESADCHIRRNIREPPFDCPTTEMKDSQRLESAKSTALTI